MNKSYKVIALTVLISWLLSSCASSAPPQAQSLGNQVQSPQIESSAGKSPRASVDIVVEGDYVVTVDATNRIIEQGAVAVRDGRIVAVGSQSDISARFVAGTVVEGKDRIVLPGLINGHSHMAMTLLRGLADDLDLMTWLNEFIFPAEVKFVNERFVRVGTQLACWEMLGGGTTTVVDMYYYPNVIAEVIEQCGMRALISSTVIGQESPDALNGEEGLANAQEFIEKWRTRHNRVTPILGPHAIYTTPPDLLLRVRDLAIEHDVPISIHLAESESELAFATSQYQASTITLLEEIGFFAPDLKVIGAHVVWPSTAEMQILAQANVGAVHNPTSNMKIAAGVSPVVDLQAAGVAVGLGTDGAASNNDLDMWEEMRIATLLQKITTQQATALPAQTVLRMATIEGARAIGLDTKVGSLEIGKHADLLQVSLEGPHMRPVFDVVSHLVYTADSQDVETVMVGGELRVLKGGVLSLDTEKLATEVNQLQQEIADAILIERE